MISLSRGIAFGPKMFSGGISNVTRQYDGKRRSSRICSVVNVLSVLFIVCTHDLFVEGATLSRQNRADAVPPTKDSTLGAAGDCCAAGFQPLPMTASVGCVKTPTLAARVETSRRNCVSESQIILHTRGVMTSWRNCFFLHFATIEPHATHSQNS